MHPRQWVVIVLVMVLTGIDGFDVLSISFASPGIARQWHVDRAALGVVLSMELMGMAVGSVVLGRLADYLGRRPLILLCLSLMTVGMFMVTTANGPAVLSLWRLLTGLGIGGMLATTNAVAAEFSSASRRQFSVSLMTMGYPIGSVIGGTVGVGLLRDHDWRSIFYFGSAVTGIFIPVAYGLMPESVSWLVERHPERLAQINATLGKWGLSPVTELPDHRHDVALTQTSARIFSRQLRTFTVLSTLGYSLHLFTFYFILKWIPSIVVDFGFPPASAGRVLVSTSLGGVAGAILFGLLSARAGLKPLTIALMLLSAVSVVAFGRSPPVLGMLSLLCASAGFCITAATVGLYGILARGFPTGARASGTGFGIGVGRGASVLAPIVAGLLFHSGYTVPMVASIMSVGSVLAAVAIALIRFPKADAGYF